MLPAIDRQRRAGDEIRLVGDKKQHAAGIVLPLAKTPHRDALNDFSRIPAGTARTISVLT